MMLQRSILQTIALLALLPVVLFTTSRAQDAAGSGEDSVLGLPVIEVRMESSADELYFVGNDYSPNTITVRVWIKNVSTDTAVARNLDALMVSDTRFNIIGPTVKPVADSLMPGDEASTTFELAVASERSDDGTDIIRVLGRSSNANSQAAQYPIWVQREFYPVFEVTCTKLFGQIVFDDDINDYTPNPFSIEVRVRNTGEGVADSVVLQYIGVRYVSVYELDSSRKFIGVLNPGDEETLVFQLRPSRRTFDTTVDVCFQVRGIGGYLRKNYVEECCTPVFLPAAKQAEYEVICDVEPDIVEFIDHEYTPNPFRYSVFVTNIGTALGKDVKAEVSARGLELVPGETWEKSIGDLPTGSTVQVEWWLRTPRRFERETVTVSVRVHDAFNNQGVCADSVIIDSIRTARFDVSCFGPDTIYADSQLGIYTNSPFDMSFTVCNVGSDYADSVKATIIIQSPNVVPLAGYPVVIEKALIEGTDTLEVQSCYTFRWALEALPTAVTTPVRIRFTVQALNAEPVDCEWVVVVQRLDAPNLEVNCWTIPEDSVRFDPSTGGYFPQYIVYRVEVTNIGGGIARNVKATLTPPPRTLLAEGETWEKLATPPDIGPNQTAVVEWVTIPIKRTDVGSVVAYRAEVIAENVVSRPLCLDTIFVPALPRTAAFAIPRNNIGYTGQLILVPIFVDDPTDKDIKKIEMELYYNRDEDGVRLPFDVVDFLEIVQFNSLTAGWTVLLQESNPENDRLRFVIESGTPLAYPANVSPEFIPPLLWLQFRASFGTSPREFDIESTPLLWPDESVIQQLVLINDGSIFPLVTAGHIWVSGDCLRPLTASPNYIIFNKPNPFNPSTMIEYRIPVEERVRIAVFDALGREVAVLVDETRPAGWHQVLFHAEGLASGMYFYRIETPNFTRVRKMVVSK